MEQFNKSGIYKILNKTSGKFYIGSTKHFKQRWNRHISGLKRNKHHNRALQFAYNKIGLNNLEFIVLEECPIENLIEREQYYLDTLKPKYNSCKIAGSCAGVIHSEQTRKKTSERQMGKPLKHMRKPVYCMNTKTVYSSALHAISDIKKNFNIKLTPGDIAAVSGGKRNSCNGFVFCKLSEIKFTSTVFSLKLVKNGIKLVPRNKERPTKRKKIKCITTNEVFESLAAAVKYFNDNGIEIGLGNIWAVLKGRRNHTKGLKFVYL